MLPRIGRTIRSCATLTRGRHGVVGGMDNVAWTRVAAQDESRAEALASARPFRSSCAVASVPEGSWGGRCPSLGFMSSMLGTGRGSRQRKREQSAAPPTMEIASDVALNQTGLKRRRRRSSARLVRLAVAAGLIGLVFTSPSEAIYLLALTSMPLMMLYGELSVLERSLLVLLYLAGISVLYVLIALMSSRKIPILYLRKFGLSRAKRMVTRAIEGGLGRQYRVLTLDDSDFKPLEIPRIERILSRVAIPIALLLLLVTLVSFMGGEKLGLPEPVVVRLFYWLPFAYGYGGILLIWPLLTLIAIVFAVLVYRWRIRRSFKLEIRSREQIYGCLIRAQRLGRWLMRPSMMAPQALVVKVIDELWQEAVSTLAEGLKESMCHLLDDFVYPRQQRWRDRQPERFGGLEVDDQLERGGLLD